MPSISEVGLRMPKCIGGPSTEDPSLDQPFAPFSWVPWHISNGPRTENYEKGILRLHVHGVSLFDWGVGLGHENA